MGGSAAPAITGLGEDFLPQGIVLDLLKLERVGDECVAKYRVRRTRRIRSVNQIVEAPVQQQRGAMGIKEHRGKRVVVMVHDELPVGQQIPQPLFIDGHFVDSSNQKTFATINPATVFRLGDQTGSIAVGKLAELALIDGDPSKNIGDLRQVELVMRDGKIMDAQALRESLGISGPPKK